MWAKRGVKDARDWERMLDGVTSIDGDFFCEAMRLARLMITCVYLWTLARKIKQGKAETEPEIGQEGREETPESRSRSRCGAASAHRGQATVAVSLALSDVPCLLDKEGQADVKMGATLVGTVVVACTYR